MVMLALLRSVTYCPDESAKGLLELYDNIELTIRLKLNSTARTNQLKTAVLRASIAKPGEDDRSIILLIGSFTPWLLVVP